jgi:hypothetical protein
VAGGFVGGVVTGEDESIDEGDEIPSADSFLLPFLPPLACTVIVFGVDFFVFFFIFEDKSRIAFWLFADDEVEATELFSLLEDDEDDMPLVG